ASLIFTGAEERGDDFVFYFDRMLAGGVITGSGDSHAAEITVRNGVVTELRAQLISFTQTEESAELMSETMACAAAGGEFTLAFVPSGGSYIPCWLES
ncbi:MAG: hypothetical protein HUJ65_06100, partial [Oscillospiraceae bacterium]|nr:hypothetical protein [Oscillospiraceae bacterium]